MKKQEERREKELHTKINSKCVAMSINTCIACGRRIPEGILVCRECEVGTSSKRCAICYRLIAESERICPNCKTVIFRSKNKD